MVTRVTQVAVLATLVALAGCDSPARVKPWRHAPDPTSEAARAPSSPALADVSAAAEVRAARGHTLRIHVDADPGRLNPVVTPTVWGRRITQGTIFEPLIRYLPPEPGHAAGRFAPRLARSWRVLSVPGGYEIRIELEPGMTFSDGHNLSSSDVQFTLDAIRDPRRGIDHLRPMLADVFAVELITPLEVRIVLTKPAGFTLRALAEIPIFPMHIYDGSLLAGGQLVGSGPYKLVSNKGGIVHLTRNDRYWAGKSSVPIQDIEFVYQPDAAIALKDAKRGDLDIVPALIPAHWPEQASAPGIASSFVKLELGGPRLRYLGFNATRAPLDDAQIRHALALLIDRRSIAKRVFDGLARPALWPIWPGGPVSGAEAAIPEFDPGAAAKLLDAAGWMDTDKDGIRDRDGKQLKLVMIGGEKPEPREASAPPVKLPRDYFIEAARRIGVVIEVKTGGESWIAKHVEEGSYDLVEMQWSGMVDTDLTMLLAGKNPQHAASPKIERTLDAMGAAWDPAERGKLAADLTAALGETWSLAGIVADAPQGLVHKRVKNVRVWDGWIDLAALAFDDKP